MKKRCSGCRKTKDISEFYKAKSGKFGVHNQCKECKDNWNSQRSKESRHQEYLKHSQYYKDWELKKHYGITREQYNHMLCKQEYLCAICGKHQSESHKGLHVDHCHDTNNVRGLLCCSCNLAIGQLKHNITILKKAIQYLGG